MYMLMGLDDNTVIPSPNLPVARAIRMIPPRRMYTMQGVGGTGAGGLGLVLTGEGTHQENVGIAGPLGATITSLRKQVDSSQSYKALPDARWQALAALDQYSGQLRYLKGKVDAENYDLFGANSVRDVNAQLKVLKSNVGALRGQILAVLRKEQSDITTGKTIKEQADAAKRALDEDKQSWWDQYKTPVYVGSALVGAALLAYLLGPLIRGVGARVAAAPAPKAA